MKNVEIVVLSYYRVDLVFYSLLKYLVQGARCKVQGARCKVQGASLRVYYIKEFLWSVLGLEIAGLEFRAIQSNYE